MRTPFVAHAPSILVVHAREAVIAACKAAGASIGMPVRTADAAAAPQLVRDTRPLVLVRDVASPGSAPALVAELATSVDAEVFEVQGGETPEALGPRLRDACVRAEKRRHS